jgi:hypothetical protein
LVRGLKEELAEDERYAVADHLVAQLKERGDYSPLSAAKAISFAVTVFLVRAR